MVGPYRGEVKCGRCEERAGITGGGYTSGWDRGRDPRIPPECDQFGTTGPTGAEVELVSLSIFRWSSPEEEDSEVGERSGFTSTQFGVSTNCGCG